MTRVFRRLKKINSLGEIPPTPLKKGGFFED
jgi:hypothetical protein